jgi:hypothetical protein
MLQRRSNEIEKNGLMLIDSTDVNQMMNIAPATVTASLTVH